MYCSNAIQNRFRIGADEVQLCVKVFYLGKSGALIFELIPVGCLSFSPEEEASDAINKLTCRDVDQMPVLQGGRFVGMLRVRDIMRWLEIQAGRG